MANIPKRVADRIKTGIKAFRKILADAQAADRSEQDTVTIVTDMLADVFGYDKYSDLTGEYSIRGTFCDLAVKIDGKVRYLVEVKAVGKSLRENHLRQATDYAAKEGIEWVVLTNGVEWQAYRMIFEQPVRYDHVFSLDVKTGGSEINDLVYMLSREGITKQKIGEYHEQRQILNRCFISAVLLSDPVLSTVRRELRRISPNVRIEVDDLKAELSNNVIKRDIIEGDEIKDAMRRVSKVRSRKLAERKPAAPRPAANVLKGSADERTRETPA